MGGVFMDMKRVFVLFAAVFLITGCADSLSFSQAMRVDEVGFFYGLWHGMIIPFAWFISLFDDSVAIYAIYNNGGWYDFGFFLGIGGLSGVGFLRD
jgi:hypothetical protein